MKIELISVSLVFKPISIHVTTVALNADEDELIRNARRLKSHFDSLKWFPDLQEKPPQRQQQRQYPEEGNSGLLTFH